jgi:hypothetical protein
MAVRLSMSEATQTGGNQIAVLESRRNWMTAAVLK